MKKLLKIIIYGICEQCTGKLFTVEKVKYYGWKKKKKKRSVNKRKRSFQPNLNGHTMLTVSLVKQKTRRPLIIYQEARRPLKRTPKKKKKKIESKNTNYTMWTLHFTLYLDGVCVEISRLHKEKKKS